MITSSSVFNFLQDLKCVVYLQATNFPNIQNKTFFNINLCCFFASSSDHTVWQTPSHISHQLNSSPWAIFYPNLQIRSVLKMKMGVLRIFEINISKAVALTVMQKCIFKKNKRNKINDNRYVHCFLITRNKKMKEKVFAELLLMEPIFC